MSICASVVITTLSIHAAAALKLIDAEYPYFTETEVVGDKTIFKFESVDDVEEMPFEGGLQAANIPYDQYWADEESNEYGNFYFRISEDGQPVYRQINPRELKKVDLNDVRKAFDEGRIEQFIEDQEFLADPNTVLSWESQINNPVVPK